MTILNGVTILMLDTDDTYIFHTNSNFIYNLSYNKIFCLERPHITNMVPLIQERGLCDGSSDIMEYKEIL